VKAGLALAAALLLPCAFAQPRDAGWQACTALAETSARLACFDAWARSQQPPALAAPVLPVPPVAPATPAATDTAAAQTQDEEGCNDPANSSELSRFWELERRTSCGTFGLRGYRPVSLSLVTSNIVNKQPSSENPANNAAAAQPYRTFETRIQLSVRSKLAEGLLRKDDGQLDSLWFGYSQQSYWQLFTREISRPFRSTDHEPELVYVYPFKQAVANTGWQLRYGGLGIVHQSNGQSLPLSRSWNRVYLMAGAEHPNGLTLQGRLWKRLPEDATSDDNPEISNYIGRAELVAGWSSERGQRWIVTWRTPLDRLDRGSARLQWLVPVRTPFSGPRFGSLNVHTQLFTGYGDTLLDYNRARTVLSVGLSLFDW
jgi:phospholipase A1